MWKIYNLWLSTTIDLQLAIWQQPTCLSIVNLYIFTYTKCKFLFWNSITVQNYYCIDVHTLYYINIIRTSDQFPWNYILIRVNTFYGITELSAQQCALLSLHLHTLFSWWKLVAPTNFLSLATGHNHLHSPLTISWVSPTQGTTAMRILSPYKSRRDCRDFAKQPNIAQLKTGTPFQVIVSNSNPEDFSSGEKSVCVNLERISERTEKE